MSGGSDTVVTRFAPSPSGSLHIGGARTALFCWAYARRHGGRFMVRVEDTDRARSSDASAALILDALAWLGIDWDDGPAYEGHGLVCGKNSRPVGPYRQSQRLASYDEQIERLIGEGRAYAAFETPEELDRKRSEALARKERWRYDRAALEIPADERAARVRAGEDHVVRFKVPDEPVTVHDEVLGDVSFAPEEVDDFILRKRDGYPTYHFAVVVDDELMGVTHVLRGQEHLNNTPRHVALQQAMGFRTPVYAHMPLIFNEQGAKMSKREQDQAARRACRDAGLEASPIPEIDDKTFCAWLGDKKRQLEADQVRALAAALEIRLPEVSVEDFRAAGYLPEVITNFIALLGWNPGDDVEKFDMRFLAERFDFDRIGKSNARFDRVKLSSFNQDAIGAMDDGEFERRWRAWCEAYAPSVLERVAGDRFALLARAVRPRAKTLADAVEPARFALIDTDEIAYDEKAVKKFLLKGEPSGVESLAAFRPVLESLGSFDEASIDGAMKTFCEQQGLGMGKVAQPLRVAMTGAGVSPGIGQTLEILGRETVLARIDRCVAMCRERAGV